LFSLGLWLRLIWTNGDGSALVVFFVGLSLVAFLVGTVFTGKTWCNYICPVSFIEKIYTEPNGLRETRNSQCTKCTACKKACPDINEENGYWKEIESPTKRVAYFAYPGLVLGFYTYYWLQSGTWAYYFSGDWTDQAGVINFAFLPGTNADTAGFFFLQAVPRALAAALTLAIFAGGSFALFALLEPVVRRYLRRRDPATDLNRPRHVMFGIAAFTAFVTFYSFAGQPTLRKIEWLPPYASILIVFTASLFLVRRLTRTPQAFAEQTVARNIIKRWEWADVRPPTDLHDAYVMHTARSSERERAYTQVLEAYQDAVRETLASGLVTREEVQRLDVLRNQLQIKRSDHDRMMASLAEEQRALLDDPTGQPTAEERLQLETYARALANYLERGGSVDGADDKFLQQLRQEFRVTPEQHQAVLDRVLRGAESEGAVLHLVEALQTAEFDTRALVHVRNQSSPGADFFADVLARSRRRAIQRLLRGVGTTFDTAATPLLLEQLESADEANHVTALNELSAQLPDSLATRLQDARAHGMSQAMPADVASAYVDHPDPYVRSAALYFLAERNLVARTRLDNPPDEPEHPLVEETAWGMRARGGPSGGSEDMLTIEKMIALRCVPIFASLGPVELEQLARSSTEVVYAARDALCLLGEPGNEVFVVLTGQVNIVSGIEPDSPLIRAETAGSVIGEMAVLDSAPRSASVFATTNGTRVLRLDGSAFRSTIDADPAVADGVIHTLVRRIRDREVPEAVPVTDNDRGGPTARGFATLLVLGISVVIAASLLVGGSIADAAAPDKPKKSHACDGCPEIFRPFADASGSVRSHRIDKSLDASNAFFDEELGKADQACYDCHQPRQGFTILVPAIQSSFDETAGTDSIFATSDTANRPDADTSTVEARRAAFSLFLNLGIVRIGKSQPAAGDFTIVPQVSNEFGAQPKPSCANNDLQQRTDCDPQGLGVSTFSLFRRPLVNTNVFFDSAVLWDGRASINNMDGQVKRAAQTLLLSETCDTPVSPTPCTPTITPAQEHDIARFMTGVFTAQETDNAAGPLDALRASGGVRSLTDLASDPAQPCRTTRGALTVFTPAGCTPAASPTMTLFDAWATLPTRGNGRNDARLAVARGQALFNGGAQLHQGSTVLSCSSCHALNNLGANPADTAPLSFVRLGLDSPDFLATLAAEDGRLASLVDRTKGLPVYTVDGQTCPAIPDPLTSTPISGTNIRSSDPGRALVTGHCADLGAFKPPLLRDVAVRAPYFHNGSAATLDNVVNFYNARFRIGLTAQQHGDLVAFLNSL